MIDMDMYDRLYLMFEDMYAEQLREDNISEEQIGSIISKMVRYELDPDSFTEASDR